MLVIPPDVKKHHDACVAFAKQQGLYDAVAVPAAWQAWLSEAGERRLVIAMHEAGEQTLRLSSASGSAEPISSTSI